MLRNSDLRVSRLAMGGCPMGGYGWGDVRENDLIDAVHAALDAGVNFFDTADTYGLGQSERTLGKALGGQRSEAVIATKFGVRIRDGVTFYDNSPQWVRCACEDSLRRLGTDYIDLYQIHYRDGMTPLGDTIEMLRRLREEGKIRYFGLSNVYGEHLQEVEPFAHEFVSVQNEYSLACRKNEGNLNIYAEKLALTPMTWGSLGQGILTGKYDANVVFGDNDRRSREVYVNFHGEKLLKNLQIVEEIRKIAMQRNVPASAVALRFILDHIPGSVALCGAKRPAQILGNVQALGWELTKEELEKLDLVSG